MTSLFLNTAFGRFAYQDRGEGDNVLIFLHGGAANLRAMCSVMRAVIYMIRLSPPQPRISSVIWELSSVSMYLDPR